MYKFENLLKKDENGDLIGAMAPVIVAKTFAKSMSIPFHGLVRLINNQCHSGYDHLIIVTKFRKRNAGTGYEMYSLIADLGTAILPIALAYSNESEVQLTPLYEKEVKRMDYHRDNCEMKNYEENPLIDLKEKEFIDMFKQLTEEKTYELNKEST